MRIYDKLGLCNRVELVLYVLTHRGPEKHPEPTPSLVGTETFAIDHSESETSILSKANCVGGLYAKVTFLRLAVWDVHIPNAPRTSDAGASSEQQQVRSNGYTQQLPSVSTPIHPSPETPNCKHSLHPKGGIGPLRTETSALCSNKTAQRRMFVTSIVCNVRSSFRLRARSC